MAVPLGIQKIRLTGGEPLMRPDLPKLIAKLSAIPGIRDLALTTNAVLLADAAQPLYDAGLAVSTSTSIPSTPNASARSLAATTRTSVLKGLAASQKIGFESSKSTPSR